MLQNQRGRCSRLHHSRLFLPSRWQLVDAFPEGASNRAILARMLWRNSTIFFGSPTQSGCRFRMLNSQDLSPGPSWICGSHPAPLPPLTVPIQCPHTTIHAHAARLAHMIRSFMSNATKRFFLGSHLLLSPRIQLLVAKWSRPSCWSSDAENIGDECKARKYEENGSSRMRSPCVVVG
ncbi:hypothetical protein Mapa_012352 [Marchantia paleacea]|nr:hypothetical protein Mapa_012352 [Marchantia paleacea]